MSKREKFLEAARSQVNKGIYVWGGDGQNLSAMSAPVAWIERHETDAKNAARAVKLYHKRVEDGVTEIRAFDCSGLVYWALHKLGLQKSDVSSRGLYALCDKIEKKELRPGDLVFHHDGKQIVHVGVCVGDKQIECRGRDVGVVINNRKSGYWNRFGRWKAFEDGPAKQYVYVKGGSVRVRAGNGTFTRCIGITHKGDEFPCLGQADASPYWYKIEYRGGTAYITCNQRYTEVVYKA